MVARRTWLDRVLDSRLFWRVWRRVLRLLRRADRLAGGRLSRWFGVPLE